MTGYNDDGSSKTAVTPLPVVDAGSIKFVNDMSGEGSVRVDMVVFRLEKDGGGVGGGKGGGGGGDTDGGRGGERHNHLL